MYCYCIFCDTTRCAQIAKLAEIVCPCRAIQPKQVQHLLTRGVVSDIERDLLPGYLFLYFEKERLLDFSPLRGIDGVIRCLHDSPDGYELAGKDEAFAKMLLEKNGVIGQTPVYEEGGMFYIHESAFDGIEAQILKVDRRKHRMKIEIHFAGQNVSTWVEYRVTNEAS